MAIPKGEASRDSICVFVDSKFRVSPTTTTSSDFKYRLDAAVDRVKDIDIRSIQIPRSYYVINARNNVIQLTAGTGIVAPGNYSINTLIVALTTVANAVGGGPYTITYSDITGKLTIASGAAFQVLTTAPNNICFCLGFSVDSAIAVSNTGDKVVDISGPNYLIVKSQALTQYRAKQCVGPDGRDNKSILTSVQINTNPSIININSPIYHTATITINGKPQRIPQDLDFQLYDSDGNLLDLNGGEWTLQLVFKLE